jgi:hypothetical protein
VDSRGDGAKVVASSSEFGTSAPSERFAQLIASRRQTVWIRLSGFASADRCSRVPSRKDFAPGHVGPCCDFQGELTALAASRRIGFDFAIVEQCGE